MDERVFIWVGCKRRYSFFLRVFNEDDGPPNGKEFRENRGSRTIPWREDNCNGTTPITHPPTDMTAPPQPPCRRHTNYHAGAAPTIIHFPTAN